MRQDWSEREVAEVDSILARLEEAKRRIIELEKRKLDLSHEERRLNDQYEEDELRYRSMVNGNFFIPMQSILICFPPVASQAE